MVLPSHKPAQAPHLIVCCVMSTPSEVWHERA
jgi:hypothetical protein